MRKKIFLFIFLLFIPAPVFSQIADCIVIHEVSIWQDIGIKNEGYMYRGNCFVDDTGVGAEINCEYLFGQQEDQYYMLMGHAVSIWAFENGVWIYNRFPHTQKFSASSRQAFDALTTHPRTFNPVEELPDGCVPPDPCAGLEPDIDSDGDGICDRCDFAPNNIHVGRYVRQWGSTSDNDIFYTYHSQSDLASMTVAEQSSAILVGSTGIANTGTSSGRYYIDMGLPIIAEQAECVCGQDCSFVGLDGSSIAGQEFIYPGSKAPTVAPPGEPPSEPENQIPQAQVSPPGTVDEVGEHGTPSVSVPVDSTAPPEAQNSQIVADNLKVISSILDNELNESNARFSRLAELQSQSNQKLSEISSKLDEPVEIDVGDAVSQLPPDNVYDSSLLPSDMPPESDLAQKMSDWAVATPFIDSIQGSGINILNSNPCLTGVIAGQNVSICFDEYENFFKSMGFILVGLSGIYAFFIIVGRS